MTSSEKKGFLLDRKFIDKFSMVKPNMDKVGEITHQYLYSQTISSSSTSSSSTEKWFETCERVVNGLYSIMKNHVESNKLGWDDKTGQESAQEMYSKIFDMEMLPAGRVIQNINTHNTNLSECSFISTRFIDVEGCEPFCEMMDKCMFGTSIGSDIYGVNKIILNNPLKDEKKHVVQNSFKGFVNALRVLLNSYFNKGNYYVVFEYSTTCPKYIPKLFEKIRVDLEKNLLIEGQRITITTIANIIKHIGKMVRVLIFGGFTREGYLAGNYTLQTTDISKEIKDLNTEFLNLKNSTMCSYITQNKLSLNNKGMMNILFLDNCRNYAKMNGIIDVTDKNVQGMSNYLEQPLEHHENYIFTTIYMNRIKGTTREEKLVNFKRTIKFAYLMGKTLTLCPTHCIKSNRVMMKNRRIGLSLSGIVQFLTENSLDDLRLFCEEGTKCVDYWDKKYSEWLAVSFSVRKCTIRHDITTGLLAGATPGMQIPVSNFYIQYIILPKNSILLHELKETGYEIEDSTCYKDFVRVSFPTYINVKHTLKNTSMYWQLELAAFLQRYWSDNGVGCTIFYNPKTESVEEILPFYSTRLKSISFRPSNIHSQNLCEEISKDKYIEKKKKLRL